MKLATLSHIPWPENNLDPKTLMENACAEVVLAENLGFDSAWFAEHHFSRYGLGSSSLMVLSHFAAITKTIELGTAVLLPTLHNPSNLPKILQLLNV
jgi:Coenzyme F420-dependent N5,N10-methylene tetrahydromethanopterin reductase and related flavin-dependent oxidoreductases